MVHAIITGGSSGIGLEVARQLMERGASVSLIARDRDRLEKACTDLADGLSEKRKRIFTATADVTDRAVLAAAISAAEQRFGACDILVVSAGRVDPAMFDDQLPELFDAQVNLNFIGAVNAARLVYRGMKTRKRGKIVFVSSGAAAIGIPGYTAYCASKIALKGFVESLHAEARPFGVLISVAYPPDTHTPQYLEEMLHRPAQAKKIMGTVAPWTPHRVADKIVRALDRGTKEVHFGFALTMLALFGAFIKPVVYWLASRGQWLRRHD